MIDTLLSAVQAVVNIVEKDQKEAYFQEREKRNQSFATLIDNLKKNVRNTLSAIRHIVADEKLNNDQKIV